MAAVGASIVCMDFHRAIAAHLCGGGELHSIDGECVAEWIDAIRDRIGISARSAGLGLRDYAATVVALVAGSAHSVVVHVGDGAVVVRDHVTKEWSVPSWPFHGQYANVTRFVTDDPKARFELVHIDAPVDRFAMFSDGIENLVLDHRKKCASATLLERLLQPVASMDGPGRSRTLSTHLRNFLDSDVVCDETDDDKSLILGARP